MMISISAVESDPTGNVILDVGKSELGKVEARVSRVSTLDGNAVVIHSGVSQADRVFNVKTTIDEYQKEILEHLNENHPTVSISCSEGFFKGTISSLDTSKPDLKMTILVTERTV